MKESLSEVPTMVHMFDKQFEMAQEYHVIIVLKGSYTRVCTPEGQVFINSTGNSGMATAGAGDVLTGIITGLLAQQYLPYEAAVFGVYLHGLAGDLALEKESKESLTATDIIEYIGNAYKSFDYKYWINLLAFFFFIRLRIFIFVVKIKHFWLDQALIIFILLIK